MSRKESCDGPISECKFQVSLKWNIPMPLMVNVRIGMVTCLHDTNSDLILTQKMSSDIWPPDVLEHATASSAIKEHVCQVMHNL